MILAAVALLSGLSFLFYGYGTLFKSVPRDEFDRYGMSGMRGFVGTMQLLGGAGVIVGLRFAPLGALAAAGLTVMMVLALLVRTRLGDAPHLMVPAAALGLLNAALVVLFIGS